MNSDSEADSCRTNCKNAHCGDGVIDADEECDDSNLSNGDGCDSQCMDEPHGPFPGDIIITEIMNNPHLTADAFGEYFEVYNTRDYPIDINRWEIASSGDPVHTIEHSGPLLVPPFGYAVLGLSGDFELNGGVPVDYVYSNILLLNGADTLKISFNGTDIDVVAYDGGPEFPSPSGPSMNLDPDHFDHISNNNGASWCFSTEPLPSGDKGTPGQPNTPCP
jgi:cysteine-rich repeat protein